MADERPPLDADPAAPAAPAPSPASPGLAERFVGLCLANRVVVFVLAAMALCMALPLLA